jgi:RNA polymerase sigma-70 factor, ECF subfamily
MTSLATDVAARLHRRARAERWGVSIAEFTAVLERSARAIKLADPAARARGLEALHLEDLALACACERGDEAAWEHFVRELRPTLYRAASAIAGQGGRELADSLYADLFGLRERDGERLSLFRYFHGRSSLGTWLRAVLAQRHVDTVRAGARLRPLPDEESPATPVVVPADPGGESRRHARRVREALAVATARLTPRDRLRLAWYYAHGMTLAQIGRLGGEHEATISRHLSRTRRALREDVVAQLRAAGLRSEEIDECFAAAAADPGDANLDDLLADGERKVSPDERSTIEEPS